MYPSNDWKIYQLHNFEFTFYYNYKDIQYRHLIPAPVDRTSAYAWFYKHPWITFQNIFAKHINDPHSLWIKLRLVVRSSMQLCPGKLVAIGHAVVYFAQATHAFSAGIKCRHCITSNKLQNISSSKVFMGWSSFATSSVIIKSIH